MIQKSHSMYTISIIFFLSVAVLYSTFSLYCSKMWKRIFACRNFQSVWLFRYSTHRYVANVHENFSFEVIHNRQYSFIGPSSAHQLCVCQPWAFLRISLDMPFGLLIEICCLSRMNWSSINLIIGVISWTILIFICILKGCYIMYVNNETDPMVQDKHIWDNTIICKTQKSSKTLTYFRLLKIKINKDTL